MKLENLFIIYIFENLDYLKKMIVAFVKNNIVLKVVNIIFLRCSTNFAYLTSEFVSSLQILSVCIPSGWVNLHEPFRSFVFEIKQIFPAVDGML